LWQRCISIKISKELTMFKLVTAGAIALAFSSVLAGCATTQSPLSSSSNPNSAFISDVQSLALTACAFVPTADAIAKIWLAEAGSDARIETLASMTAQTACQAYASLISSKTSKRRKSMQNGVVDFGSVTVNGKAIELTGRPQ